MESTTYIHVRATTGAKREVAEQISTAKWRICVREKPERGAANRQIRQVLARHLRVQPQALRLIKGATSPSKTYKLL